MSLPINSETYFAVESHDEPPPETSKKQKMRAAIFMALTVFFALVALVLGLFIGLKPGCIDGEGK